MAKYTPLPDKDLTIECYDSTYPGDVYLLQIHFDKHSHHFNQLVEKIKTEVGCEINTLRLSRTGKYYDYNTPAHYDDLGLTDGDKLLFTRDKIKFLTLVDANKKDICKMKYCTFTMDGSVHAFKDALSKEIKRTVLKVRILRGDKWYVVTYGMFLKRNPIPHDATLMVLTADDISSQ